MSPVNYLDIILSIPLFWGLYKGLKKGIIKELLSLITLLLGVYGATHFSEQIQPFLIKHLPNYEPFLPVIAFAIIFVFIAVLIRLFGLALDKLIKLVALGFVSRLLGGFFGVLKSAFVISALLLIFNTIDHHLELIPKGQKKSSLLYLPISQIIPAVLPELKDGNKLIKEAEKVWKKTEEVIPL